jgi:hypothetical protein
MIEAVIACALVLVPLFLAIPILAKYQDIRFHVVQGARYAAWERTVWFGGDAAAEMGFGSISTNKWDANAKGDDAIRAEIGSRILSKNPDAFNTTLDQAGGTSLPGHDMWRDRRGTTLLQDYSDIGGSYDNDQSPGLINVLLTPVLDVVGIFSSFTLDTNAQYTASLNLSVREVAFNGDPLGTNLGTSMKGYPGDFLATSNTMTFSEKNVIVANGWSANGPGSFDEINTGTDEEKARISTYKQVRGLTPTTLLKPTDGVFKTILDVLNVVSLVLFPELSTLDLGRIEVDRVPADRLE